MKKLPFALTMLGAFAGAASAQSSVTIYGLVDVNVLHTKGGDRLGGNSVTEVADGVAYGPGSRWGLRVSEDLGSGLRANIVAESGFGADTGASTQGNSVLGVSSRLFGRQVFISLASVSAGELRLGRQLTMHDEVIVLSNPFGNTTVLSPTYYSSTAGTNPAARNTRLPLFVDSPRVDNAVQYISPSFSGFRLQAMVAAGERTANNQPGAAVAVVPNYQGIKGSYINGPVSVALSYEQNKIFGDTSNKVFTLGGNYDFGRFKLLGGYQDARDLTNYGIPYYGFAPSPTLNVIPANSATAAFTLDRLKAATIGVALPVGVATLAANYTLVKYVSAGGALDAKLGKFGLGANYALSKQTALYAAASMVTSDLKDSIQEKRVFQIGLRKSF